MFGIASSRHFRIDDSHAEFGKPDLLGHIWKTWQSLKGVRV